MTKRIILVFSAIGIGLVVFALVTDEERRGDILGIMDDPVADSSPISYYFPLPTAEPATTPTSLFSPAPSLLENEFALHDVPFTIQAPLQQWDNPMFQDGCEEASALMAMVWTEMVSEEDIVVPQRAADAIVAMSEFQVEYDGEFRDRSAEDMVALMREYFSYPHVHFRADIAVEDIVWEIVDGNVVIVPVNGRALRNPHFTPPGPERHMLVVRGWDPVKEEFITNDPGTRFGEGYRYDKDVLFAAIRDYHTGYHVPITSIEKNMIVVERFTQ